MTSYDMGILLLRVIQVAAFYKGIGGYRTAGIEFEVFLLFGNFMKFITIMTAIIIMKNE